MNSDEKDLDYFIAKIEDIANEAKEHGHDLVIALQNDDPISGNASVYMTSRGTAATIIGLSHIALLRIQSHPL